MEVELELLAAYRDPNLREKPPALDKRGGAFYSRAAVELMAAIHLDRSERQVVNLRNAGTIACLPDDCVVEVPARIDARGAHPLPLDPPELEIRGLMQQVKAYEELAVQAAVGRRRRFAVLALVNHPLVADLELAAQLVDEIAAEHGIVFEEEGSA